MKTTHTPGPWVVKNGTSILAGKSQVANTGFKMGDWPKEDYETERANARLIAAAPDLLAALEMVVNAADTGWEISDGAWMEIQAAIAKAKGGAE
jgi:hypothetical protein